MKSQQQIDNDGDNMFAVNIINFPFNFDALSRNFFSWLSVL